MCTWLGLMNFRGLRLDSMCMDGIRSGGHVFEDHLHLVPLTGMNHGPCAKGETWSVLAKLRIEYLLAFFFFPTHDAEVVHVSASRDLLIKPVVGELPVDHLLVPRADEPALLIQEHRGRTAQEGKKKSGITIRRRC